MGARTFRPPAGTSTMTVFASYPGLVRVRLHFPAGMSSTNQEVFPFASFEIVAFEGFEYP